MRSARDTFPQGQAVAACCPRLQLMMCLRWLRTAFVGAHEVLPARVIRFARKSYFFGLSVQ